MEEGDSVASERLRNLRSLIPDVKSDAYTAQLGDASTPDDVCLRYWLHLFKGRALEQKNRPADALVAYRLAFEDVPYAQSATVSLGAALVAEHRPGEAAALITRMLAMRPAPPDPWTLYTCPDLRFWPQLLAELQKAIVP